MEQVFAAMIMFKVGTTKAQVSQILQALDPALEVEPKVASITNPSSEVKWQFVATYVI